MDPVFGQTGGRLLDSSAQGKVSDPVPSNPFRQLERVVTLIGIKFVAILEVFESISYRFSKVTNGFDPRPAPPNLLNNLATT